MTSSLDIIRGRQVVQTLTNQSGGAVIAGDVVIVSTANDESFTTTTSAAYNSTRVGVAQESIAAAATGRILLEGYAPLVNVSASATRGHYLFTHTVAKQATSQAGYAAGAFGQILKAGTTPSAMIFPVAQVGSAGVARSGATTDAHLAVWNGSNADSIKDGGVVPAGAPTLVSARYIRTAGNYTNGSNSHVDIDGTNMSFTLTTGARRVMMTLVGDTLHDSTNGIISFDFSIDGTDQGDTTLGLQFIRNQVAGVQMPLSLIYISDTLTAASHTFKARWWNFTNSGTATLYGTAGNPFAIFSVVELL